MFLTYLNRTCPKLPCTAVFADREWKSVWRVVKKQPLPQTPPVLSDFLRLLTQLGGDNNRATELPPGPQPLWIGLRRMTDSATAWLTFGPNDGASCVSTTGRQSTLTLAMPHGRDLARIIYEEPRKTRKTRN